jgi:hypothetical protein
MNTHGRAIDNGQGFTEPCLVPNGAKKGERMTNMDDQDWSDPVHVIGAVYAQIEDLTKDQQIQVLEDVLALIVEEPAIYRFKLDHPLLIVRAVGEEDAHGEALRILNYWLENGLLELTLIKEEPI